MHKTIFGGANTNEIKKKEGGMLISTSREKNAKLK